MTFERMAMVIAAAGAVCLVLGIVSEIGAARRRAELRQRWQAGERAQMARTLREAADALEAAA